ncbi:MAG: sulfatase-like hydrolase/transferase [Bacteroidia bacterium]|nr:sulfatase-like hydrolase/transferase [Bacteroidia bacterium]
MKTLKYNLSSGNFRSIAISSITLAGALVNPSVSNAQQSQARKPNIIFILADDLGIGDVRCYGADNYRTPNIDKLASQGIRFINAYTAPLSGPSRATILTGRHVFRTGATNQDATGLMKPSEEIMMPTYLKKAGYITASIGKWGQLPLNPSDFGFDHYLKFQGSGIYWNTQQKGKTYLVDGKLKDLKDNEYMPDMMHKDLVDFMAKHKDQPFYIYYSLSHVHAEILPTPDSKADSKDIYADNISYMDKLVGKLVAELEKLKLADNTILVFFGDNGTAAGHAARATIGGRRLIGQKGTMLEGGSLEPLIVYWPGVTPIGKISHDLISAVDFVPTFAEIAGADLPKDKIIDGQSFNAQIHGQKGNPRSSIFVQLANNYYVRNSDWKLNQSGELFDMSKAPFEEIPVPADTKNPDVVAARKSLQADLDRLNPAGGYVDTGDGTGRHVGKIRKVKK